jgi:phenylalanyl-tRNA synthetase beta chain
MVDLEGIPADELALRLTMATAEIDSVVHWNEHLKHVITVRAKKVAPHPDADKLTLVDSDTGSEVRKVVCGAPNHREGDILALAPEGTRLGEDFIIKKAKIRGVESRGMLCSERELGLSDDHSGIMVLPPETPVGVPLSELFPEWVDTLLEIDNKSITHRPDLWSHAGFAREIGALFGREVRSPVDRDLLKGLPESSDLKVSIDCPAEAPRYSGLVVENIKIEESPDWLRARVSAIGMRPINNIVDITNYVMAELGEPMHAFDRKKLRGDEIRVRLASKGEKLTTLDGQEHELTPEDIVIADGEGSIALAGVMGGGNSEIQEDTTEIVLEAANFNPVNIRRTAHRFNLRTEAAVHFEKALSPEMTAEAILRCYELIKEIIPGARASSPLLDAYPSPVETLTVTLTTERIRRELGEDIPDEKIISILRSLDFGVQQDGESLTLRVPHYRATRDVSIAADIVEEVGRIYGYDNIEPNPPLVVCETPEKNHYRFFERKVREILSGPARMVEVRGYSFTGSRLLDALGINEEKELHLANPLSSEQDRLRRSLVPTMMEHLEINQKQREAFAVFEVGRTYMKDDRGSKELARENRRVCGAFYMRRSETPVFYPARDAARRLVDALRREGVEYLPAADDLPPYAHPGRSLRMVHDGRELGLVFELHPAVRERLDLEGEAALFDMDLDILYGLPGRPLAFHELQRFPQVPFEVSVMTDETSYSGDIRNIIHAAGGKRVRTVSTLSEYRGEQIPGGKKSLSFRIVFADPEKTLSPEEVDSLQKSIVKGLEKEGLTLR